MFVRLYGCPVHEGQLFLVFLVSFYFFSEFCLHISLFGPTLLSQVSLRDNQLPICFLTHKNNQQFTSVTDSVEKHVLIIFTVIY